MSTSIGELSVGVALDTKKLDAGLKGMERKIKGQAKQLDAEYRKMAGAGAFGYSETVGGTRPTRGRSGGGASYGGMAGGGAMNPAQKLARTFGGQTLGRLVGGGGEALAGLGPGAIAAAAAVGMVKLQMAIVGFAKDSKKLDPATLSVISYGKALTDIGTGVKNAAKGFAVEALGTLTRFGELIGSGFSMSALTAAEGSERAAAGQEQKLANLKAVNDPARLAKSRSAIADFQRDQAFGAASPKQQQAMLRGEIAALQTKEAQAKTEGRLADSLDIRLDRLRKEAELQKNITDFTAKQKDNADAITRARAERMDAEDEAERKRAQESRETLDAVLRATEGDMLQSGLDRVRDRLGSVRNPFESRGNGDFGSASASTANLAMEGNRLLAEMTRILRSVEANTEDALARN